MSNKLDLEKYIDDIIQELPSSKYTQRFREELLEHSEDSMKELRENNETDILEKVMQKIGNREEIITQYKIFHDLCFAKIWFVETIFYSLITLPIMLLASGGIILTMGLIFSIIPIFVIAFFIIIINLVYKFIATRLAAHCNDLQRKKTIIAIITLIPIITAFVSNFNIIAEVQSYAGVEKMTFWEILLEIIGASLYAFSVYLLAKKNIDAACKNNRKEKSAPKLIYLLPIFIFIGFAIALMKNLSFNISEVLPWPLNFLFGIITIPSSILYFVISILDIYLYQIIAGVFYSMFGAVTGEKITILFIVFAGLCGLWLFASPSKFRIKNPDRWMESLGLIIFFNSMFGIAYFITSKVEEPKINWQVPTINISEKIERQEFGKFYPFIINYDISDVLDAYYPDLYRISVQDNGFTVSHVGSYNYWVETEKISSLSDLKITRQGEYIEPKQEILTEAEYFKMMEESEKNPKPLLRKGFSCTNKNGESTTLEGSEYTSPREECVGVRYYSKDIWNEPSGQVYAVYVSQSKDNNWAIINIEHNYAVFVYLVDLRSLK